ncbi:MAG: transaldolase family protein [Patescibacteria group bacterium]
MKIFIDSGDIKEVQKYLSWGICDGVTTNPSIMLKSGATSKAEAKELQIAIAKLISPRPLSVEVTTDNPEEMLQQAHDFVTWAPNIMVKITITDRQGGSMLPVIHQLAAEGIAVNVTAIMTMNQAMLAAIALENGRKVASKPAPFNHIISIFGGRISEEHGVDIASRILMEVREWLDLHKMQTEIIVGSVRTPENMDSWSTTGAHILTIPPDVLAKSQLSGRTKETVVQFLQDAAKALGALK